MNSIMLHSRLYSNRRDKLKLTKNCDMTQPFWHTNAGEVAEEIELLELQQDDIEKL